MSQGTCRGAVLQIFSFAIAGEQFPRSTLALQDECWHAFPGGHARSDLKLLSTHAFSKSAVYVESCECLR